MPKNTQRASNLLASVTEELMAGINTTQVQDNSVRVESILLEMVRPDPVQPRRVFPEHIHLAFHNNRLTPTQALRELIQIAQVAARQKGHPFSDVMDLLPKADTEAEEEAVPLSPEEQLVRDLVNLAVTIRDDGQVNPLTVVDMTQGVTRLYRIETGEWRYWATWLLRDFIPNSGSDGTIPCIIIPAQRASVFRQAKENTARAGLPAIAMARQAALLILAVHGMEKPSGAVSNDYYRQAINFDLRDTRDLAAEVLSAMGGISKVHFSHYKALLRLSDEAMELADRHQVEEKRLRYVVDLPVDSHAEVVRQIIDFNLTSIQVKQLCEQETDEQANPPEAISKHAIQMAKITREEKPMFAQEFAKALLKQERNIDVARARIAFIRRILDQAEQYLEE